MSSDRIIYFLQQNAALNITTIEKEAGIPVGTLGKVMRGERKLSDERIEKLTEILTNYGLKQPKKIKTRVISVINHKGGVGKTTTTLNLGKAISLTGKKVLLIDIDPQANLSQSLKVEDPEQSMYNVFSDKIDLPIQEIADNLFLAPSDLDLSQVEMELMSSITGYFYLKKAISKIDFQYDYIFIDCPPSLGVLTMNALLASTDALICVQSEFLAVKGLQTVLGLIAKLQDDLHKDLEILGMLITMTNRTIIKKNVVETLKNAYSDKVFNTNIRQNIKLVEASALGQDVFSYAPSSSAAQDYEELAKEIMERINQ